MTLDIVRPVSLYVVMCYPDKLVIVLGYVFMTLVIVRPVSLYVVMCYPD